MTEHRAEQTAREAALRQVLDLPWRDVYEVYTTLGEYLKPQKRERETKTQRELRERAEALEALERAARHLKLPADRAPTVEQYNRAATKLGLDLSSAQVVRRWGFWREASNALVRKARTETPEQRAVRRATTGKRRGHADYLAGVREWLRGKPASTTEKDYDAWVERRNEQNPDALPYVKGGSVIIGLSIQWPRVLAVARRKTTLGAAQAEYLEELTAAAGRLQLVGSVAVGLILGKGSVQAADITREPGFPPRVATIGNARVWYRDDIEAYKAGRSVRRREGELQPHIVDSKELRKLLALKPAMLVTHVHKRRFHLVPEPAGTVSQNHYWLREDLEPWLEQYGESVRKRVAKGRASGVKNAKNRR